MTAEQVHGEDTAGRAAEPPVTMEHEFERADFEDSLKVLLRRNRLQFALRPWFLTSLLVLGLLLVALDAVRGGISAVETDHVLGLVWPTLLFFYPRWAAHAALKANRHQGVLRVSIDDHGVSIAGLHAETRTGWASYGGYVETDRSFLLRSPDKGGRCAVVLPKRGIAGEAELGRLRAILDRHLPRR